MGYKLSWIVSSLQCLDVDDHSIINAFLRKLGRIKKHMWPVIVCPNVSFQIKPDSFSKENNKGIIFDRIQVWYDQQFYVKEWTFFKILFWAFSFFLNGSKWYECITKFGNSHENKYSSKSTKLELFQQTSDKLHNLRWFVYIDGPLWGH